jgi:hypothetical protein
MFKKVNLINIFYSQKCSHINLVFFDFFFFEKQKNVHFIIMFNIDKLITFDSIRVDLHLLNSNTCCK